MCSPALADFLDHAAADSCAAEAADRSEVGFALDDGEPGDAVVEHGGCGHEDGVVQRGIEGVGWEEIAEFAAGYVAARLGGNDSDTGGQVVEVVAVQCAPEALLFVENEELTGWGFVESDDCVGKGCL